VKGDGSGVAEGPTSGMDEKAIADAYRAHAPAILAHCRRILLSAPLARDATQEVFVKVLASRRTLPRGDEGLRYLYRVATNHCLNQLRDGRVRQRAASDLSTHVGDRAAEPAYVERQFIEKLLEQSPRRDLEIAVLHWLDGMTQVEIAATLGMSRRGVYSRLKRVETLAARMGQPVPVEGGLPVAAAEQSGPRLARQGDA
jgi:RNA polymerase sigma-70 factor (ECF subfamily)